MNKITSYYEPYKKDNPLGKELNNGDVVFCRASSGTSNFYGMYVYGVGIIDLEYGSTAYIPSSEKLHLKETINYWTIEKVFKNVEIVIKEQKEDVED